MIAAIYARKSTDQHRGISARGMGEAVLVTAIGYVRRSKESGARTVSLEDQRARIADYAQGQGWQVAEVVADDGVSGGRRERLERLAERVRVTGARVIVAHHLDRFARDPAGTLDYLRRFARRGSSSTWLAGDGWRWTPRAAFSWPASRDSWRSTIAGLKAAGFSRGAGHWMGETAKLPAGTPCGDGRQP